MKGAIIGDIVGSRFEFDNLKGSDRSFELFHRECKFTDDSLMTLAVAKTLLECPLEDDRAITAATIKNMREIAKEYPLVSWGTRFCIWLFVDADPQPFNSFGNGAGMRVSPVAWVAACEEEVKRLARLVTEVSHNHPEGLKGAEAIAMAVYLARIGKDRGEIRERMSEYYPILRDSTFCLPIIRLFYGHDPEGKWETCQGSVPHAIEAFLESESFEDALRLAVGLGGDSDTIADMTCAIAEAYYGLPEEMERKLYEYLPDDLAEIVRKFDEVRLLRVSR